MGRMYTERGAECAFRGETAPGSLRRGHHRAGTRSGGRLCRDLVIITCVWIHVGAKHKLHNFSSSARELDYLYLHNFHIMQYNDEW